MDFMKMMRRRRRRGTYNGFLETGARNKEKTEEVVL